MASFPLRIPAVPGDTRAAGLAVTVFVHLALVVLWQVARTLPPQVQAPEAAVQWLRLPPPRIEPQVLLRETVRPRAGAAPGRAALPVSRPAAPTPAVAPEPEAPLVPAAPATEAPARPSVEQIMESARRSVGSIDRALRKENKATIVAPPDSPQIRMRESMEQAHALAPPRLWEAPKVEELVNNTGDGARRTRVITGRRTYCVTERSPATNIEMIEMHGKIRLTNCPSDETPAKQQVWRTARD
ncbi:hypothetical protein [Massilia yuzhufengensis]|nr:hypothetical protein [Massilia yuzhufengensis]